MLRRIIFIGLLSSCALSLVLEPQWPANLIFGSSPADLPASRSNNDFAPEQTALPAEFAQIGALSLLQQARDRFRPEELPWQEMTIWQCSKFGECFYEAEGRYVGGPDHRMYLNLRLRNGPAQGQMIVKCDGNLLKKTFIFPGKAPQSSLLALSNLEPPVAGKAARSAQCERLLTDQACRGVTPLLAYFKDNLHQPKIAAVHWHGKLLLQIRGQLPNAKKINDSLPRNRQFRQTVREGRLYLDAETLWPVRVEWWGNARENEKVRLLFCTEYRRPILRDRVTAEALAKEFTVQVN